MKRLHIHIRVDDIQESMSFYSALFGQTPSVEKPDYAKWMLDDPAANVAISTRGGVPGIDHVGIQIDDAAELDIFSQRLTGVSASHYEQKETTCCYAKSNKVWASDPNGTKWELFQSYDWSETYGVDSEEAKPASAITPSQASPCCAPPTKSPYC